MTGLAAMMIADETSRMAPIIVTPTSGARVRVYTVHGDDAADAIESETALAFWPTDGDNWTLSVPCQGADLEMARVALSSAPHVVVRDIALGLALDAAEAASISSKSLEVAKSDDLVVETSWLAT